MEKTAPELVQELSDTQITEVVKALFKDLYAQIPYQEVRGASADVPELAPLLGLDKEIMGANLSAAESARLGRAILDTCARDPGLAPLVVNAIDKVAESDDMFIGVVVALGLLVNLTLLMATTEIDVGKDKKGKWHVRFKKKTADKELVSRVINPVARAVTTVTTGGSP